MYRGVPLMITAIIIIFDQSSQSPSSCDENMSKSDMGYALPHILNDDSHHENGSVKGYRHRRGSLNRQSHLSKSCDERLNKPCLSCEGHCGTASEFTYDSKNRSCSCDTQCIAYGDCCWDFAKVCPHHQPTLQQLLQQLPPMMCGSDNGPIMGVYNRLFVSACLSGKACPYIFDKITDKINSHTRPVVDLATGFHYVNYACAICNKAVNIVPWEVGSTRMAQM